MAVWNLVYVMEDYLSSFSAVIHKSLDYVDNKIDNFWDTLKKNKCQVEDFQFAPGEAWKDRDGRIKACLKGGRVAIVSGLDKSYQESQR